jgi:uncharacterized RDD family membrane protein YckC
MKKPLLHFCLVVAMLCAAGPAAPAEKRPATVPPAASAAASAAAPSEAAAAAASSADDTNHGEPDWDGRSDAGSSGGATDVPRVHEHGRRHHRGGNDLVSIGHDSHLESGKQADAVVSILGSSTSEGDAATVVSIAGDTRVTGPVRDTAVAVLGSTYVDSEIDGEAVAVFGDVELGPHAVVNGDVVAVFGAVIRDPAAIVHGDVNNVFIGDFGGMRGLRAWISNCLLYGRPLAFAPGLGWAWSIALALLAFYACLALVFRSGIEQCVQTVQNHPDRTALAALIAMLGTPVLVILLCVTVIGVAALPFVIAAVFIVALFGKAVMLAWLGRRVVAPRPGPAGHPAVAVLIGGAMALVLYVFPVLGFLVYKLLGFFGLGAVVYTLILAVRSRQALRGDRPQVDGTSSAPAPDVAMAARAAASSAEVPPILNAGPGPAGPAGPAPAPAPPNQAMPPSATAAMPRAGFWIRMAALLLDALLVGVAMSVLSGGGHLHLLALAAYGAVMWKLRGATVGGIVFDLHVVRLDGRPVDWQTAIVRALSCFLSLAVIGLGFIWIAFDAANQAWHDKIAGTVVVRVPKA